MTNGTPRLVIVGGGIIGTMHAVEAVRRGYEVVHLERDLEARRASVRNFGLIWVSGRASGAELDLALRSRARWEEIASVHADIGFRANGSITVARSAPELAVLVGAANLPDAEQRGFSLLDADEVRARNPALKGTIEGGLFCALDATVEPRLTVAALRVHLAQSGAYRFLPGRTVVRAEQHAVIDTTGARHEGDLVVCCPGASPGPFLTDALADAPIRRVRLQMLETAPFVPLVTTAVADGDSLRYYPAFRDLAAELLPPQDPVSARFSMQLLLVQRRDGRLTVGDTHAYEEPFAFDLDDEPTGHLLEVAGAITGTTLPPVERRWSGIYCEVTDPARLYYRAEIEPGVVVITGPGGRGMTMSPGIAEETFA